MVVAPSGRNMTVNSKVAPSLTSFEAGSIAISFKTISFAVTVTGQVAVLSPALAVIVAVPALTAVTLPLPSTVATLLSEDVHVTFLSVALSGATVALSFWLSPSTMLISVLSMVMPVTGTVLAATVTEHVAVLDPSEEVTVIVAEPAFTAVTLPLPSTVATVASEDFQLIALLVALFGATVAVKVSDPPSTRLNDVLFNVTPVTATVLEPPPPGISGSSGLQENKTMENTAVAITAIAVVNRFFIS